METQSCFRKVMSVFVFLPYLWGMETRLAKHNRLRYVIRSYRTYEEWKLVSNSFSDVDTETVLTVPMRNGNDTDCPRTLSLESVLTVPMRNGNTSRKWVSCHHHWRFLPYLWGMETSAPAEGTWDLFSRSYRTYEEWKHSSKCDGLYFGLQFLPYLWGMETANKKQADQRTNCSYRTYEEWKLPSFTLLSEGIA